MAEGWIKIHRQIQSCEFLWNSKDEPFDRRSAWIDLLLMANHKDTRLMFDGKAITVKRGQRVTSLRDLGLRWNWSPNKVKRYLDLLAGEGMLIRESDNRRTLLTIVKYDSFQDEWHTDGTPTAHQRDTDGTPTAHRRTTNKNENNEENEKNDKNEKKSKRADNPRQTYGEYKHVRLTEEEFNRLCNDFGDKDTLQAIKILDEYCQETGKTYKDYNLTLRRWPMEEARKKPGKKTGGNDLDRIFAEWDEKYGGNQNDKRDI